MTKVAMPPLQVNLSQNGGDVTRRTAGCHTRFAHRGTAATRLSIILHRLVECFQTG